MTILENDDSVERFLSEEYDRVRRRGYTGIECVALSHLRQQEMAAQMLSEADELGLTADHRRLLEEVPKIQFPAEVNDVEALTTSSYVMTALFGPHWLAVVELVRSLHALPEDALLRVDSADVETDEGISRQQLIDALFKTLSDTESRYCERGAEAALISAAWRCGADPRRPKDISGHTAAVIRVAQTAAFATSLTGRLDVDREAELMAPWRRLLANRDGPSGHTQA